MPLPPVIARPTTPPPRVRFPIAEAFSDNRPVVRGRRLRPSELRPPPELYPPRTPSPTYSLYPPSNASSEMLFRFSPHKSTYRPTSPVPHRLSELKIEDPSLELLRPFGPDTQGPSTGLGKSNEALRRGDERASVGKEVQVGGAGMGRIVSDSAIASRTSEWAAEQARLSLRVPTSSPIDIQSRRSSMPTRIVGFGGLSDSPPQTITHRAPQTMGTMFRQARSRNSTHDIEESLVAPTPPISVEARIRSLASAFQGTSIDQSESRHPTRHVERFLERERGSHASWSYDGGSGNSLPESEAVVGSTDVPYGSR